MYKVFAIIFFLLISISNAQDITNQLFSEVEASLKTAKDNCGDIICKKEYKYAKEHYEEALRMKDEGYEEIRINSELEESVAYLTELNEKLEQHSDLFRKVVDARHTAVSSNAEKFAGYYWAKSEKAFSDVANDVYQNDTSGVDDRINQILQDYYFASYYADRANQILYDWEPMNKATESSAKLLSPSNYSEGLEAYNDAIEMINEGNPEQEINEKENEALVKFNSAAETANRFAQTYPEVLRLREDAINAGAEESATGEWALAEETLTDAASNFEDGDDEDASEISDEAKLKYLAAKHKAVDVRLLSDVKLKIQTGRENDVPYYTPVTSAKIDSLIFLADSIIYNDNYTEERVNELAIDIDAKVYKADTITVISKKIISEDEKLESYLLDWDIFKEISAQRAEMEEETTEEPVDEETSSQSTINLYNYFSGDEALIDENENEITISLIGIKYRPVLTSLYPEDEELIKKAIEVIQSFPEATIVIAGNSDNIGTKVRNKEIAFTRADEVYRFILNNSDIAPDRLITTSFGEDKPLFDNATLEGREKNRRVDIIIKK